jgi:signal transduction histidine kinase
MEVFTDITKIKDLQRQLTLMGRAVAGMAHRIKNLLMGLEGGIFVVNTGMELGEQETIEEGWEMVERNVKTVSRLVKDLLFCSKEREPEFQDNVYPGKVLKDVGSLYAPRVEEDNIKLDVEVSKALEPGRYDPDGLHNMLSNLVANAIDACRFDPDESKKSHRIGLRCRTDSSGATVFEVEDDGAGIPEDQVEKVFLDFFSTKGTEGTGVGLLVVAKVADEHGGSVTFKSEEGKGTMFRVTIPAR